MIALILDWDNAVADAYTMELWAAARELMQQVNSDEVKIFILSARPGNDISRNIHAALLRQNIILNRDNVVWVGASDYQGHANTAAAKLNAIDVLRTNLNLDKSKLLFIDDESEYVEVVANAGYSTLQVPYSCYSKYLNDELKNENRRVFFSEVKRLIASTLQHDVNQAKTVNLDTDYRTPPLPEHLQHEEKTTPDQKNKYKRTKKPESYVPTHFMKRAKTLEDGEELISHRNRV